MSLRFLVAIFLLTVAVRVEAGDWPWWRGPDNNGISRETAWKAELPEGGPKQLWTAEVGTGFSSMAVADGRLYTMGHAGENDTIFCLDANTGKELWKHSYPCLLVDNLHEGGPASTPTVYGKYVYTVSKEGHFICLDRLTGKVIWEKNLQKLLGIEMPSWGFSGSVFPLGDQIIYEAGYTVSLNKDTGDVIWKTEEFRPGYGSPTIFHPPGGEPLIAALNNDSLILVRPKDGSIVDKFPWETNFATNATTPVVIGDSIFLSTAYDKGCALLKFYDGKLEPVFNNKSMRNHMANSIYWKGFLYGFDGNSQGRRVAALVCLDAKTGEEKWRERGMGCGSLLIADGKFIILGDEGELVTAPVDPEGFHATSRAQVIEGRCWTVPVLSHGRIYCRNAAGHVVAVDLR